MNWYRPKCCIVSFIFFNILELLSQISQMLHSILKEFSTSFSQQSAGDFKAHLKVWINVWYKTTLKLWTPDLLVSNKYLLIRFGHHAQFIHSYKYFRKVHSFYWHVNCKKNQFEWKIVIKPSWRHLPLLLSQYNLAWLDKFIGH